MADEGVNVYGIVESTQEDIVPIKVEAELHLPIDSILESQHSVSHSEDVAIHGSSASSSRPTSARPTSARRAAKKIIRRPKVNRPISASNEGPKLIGIGDEFGDDEIGRLLRKIAADNR